MSTELSDITYSGNFSTLRLNDLFVGAEEKRDSPETAIRFFSEMFGVRARSVLKTIRENSGSGSNYVGKKIAVHHSREKFEIMVSEGGHPHPVGHYTGGGSGLPRLTSQSSILISGTPVGHLFREGGKEYRVIMNYYREQEGGGEYLFLAATEQALIELELKKFV